MHGNPTRRPGLTEPLILLALVVMTAFAVLVAVDKLAFLSIYQLPVLVAASMGGVPASATDQRGMKIGRAHV